MAALTYRTVRAGLTVLLALSLLAALAAPWPTELVRRTDAAWTDREHVMGTVAMRMPRDCTTTGRYRATGEATMLSGRIGTTDLATVAGLAGLDVTDPGTGAVPDPATAIPSGPGAYRDPLGASAVAGLVAADLTGVLQLPAAGVSAGTLGQWARAGSDGEAGAAAGAVTDSGAVLVGTSGAGGTTLPGAARVDLARLAPGVSGLAGLRLDVGAVAAGARGDGCLRDEGQDTIDRQYGVASLRTVLTSPAVTGLTTTTTTALAATTATVRTLEQTLATTVRTALAPLGGSATASARIDVDLTAATAPLLSTPLTDGVVTVDLAAGTVTVDLAALTSGEHGLNRLPPNTRLLLDAAMTTALASRVQALLDAWVVQVVAAVDAALRSARVTITASVVVPLVGTVPLGVTGTLQQLVDGTATVTAGPLLSTTLAVLLPLLGTTVTGALLGPTGATAVLRTTLRAALPPVVAAVSTAVTALRSAVSITVNAQDEVPAGTWSVTALGLAVLQGSGVGTRVDLATASVGPFAGLR